MCRRQAGKGDDDIDAILSQLDLADKKSRKIDVLSNCKAPEPRVCGLWLSLSDVVRSRRHSTCMCKHCFHCDVFTAPLRTCEAQGMRAVHIHALACCLAQLPAVTLERTVGWGLRAHSESSRCLLHFSVHLVRGCKSTCCNLSLKRQFSVS